MDGGAIQWGDSGQAVLSKVLSGTRQSCDQQFQPSMSIWSAAHAVPAVVLGSDAENCAV